MEYLVKALREHQELAVFLTLALGFLFGRLRIGRASCRERVFRTV